MKKTKIFLNTWGAYNDGSIGYGWMTPGEAREFIEEDEERDGGEWFIADIDNYTGVKFANLEYCDVLEVIETLETLEAMDDWERDEVVAIMEYQSTDDARTAIDEKDDYIIWSDVESYFDSMDQLLNFNGCDDIISRYFDYDAYHHDCMFDVYEASNGVVIAR